MKRKQLVKLAARFDIPGWHTKTIQLSPSEQWLEVTYRKDNGSEIFVYGSFKQFRKRRRAWLKAK